MREQHVGDGEAHRLLQLGIRDAPLDLLLVLLLDRRVEVLQPGRSMTQHRSTSATGGLGVEEQRLEEEPVLCAS